MRCGNCHEREATSYLQEVSPSGELLSERHFCDGCASMAPRRVNADDLGVARALAAGRLTVDASLLAFFARDLTERAAHHGEALPPDVRAFLAGHLPHAP
jgi:protein-arginine kinase activator protein McsA